MAFVWKELKGSQVPEIEEEFKISELNLRYDADGQCDLQEEPMDSDVVNCVTGAPLANPLVSHTSEMPLFWMQTAEGKRIKMEQMSDEDTYVGRNHFSFPSHIPEILEVVFKNLSNQELLKIRKVSKDWNKEACRLLMLSPNPIKQNDAFQPYYSRKHQKLFKLAKDSLIPGILLKDVQISGNMNWPTDSPSNQNPFQVFGGNVRRLTIKEDLNLVLLNNFLAKQDAYCQNVEMLDYFITYYEKQKHSFFAPPTFNSCLQLKELRFKAYDKIRAPQQVAVLRSILHNSPYVNRIHIDCNNSKAMKDFGILLQSLPSVCQKLTTLQIDTVDFSHLKQLAKCTFSKNFTTLRLHYYLDDSEDMTQNKHHSELELANFLKRVATSLVELDIELTDEKNESETEDYEEDLISYPNALYDIPNMPNLKLLTLKHCIVGSLKELEYMINFPSLKILKIHSIDADISFGDLVDHFVQSKFVHDNLENIEFEKDDTFMRITDESIIPSVIEVFPNFSQIWISTLYYFECNPPIEVPFHFHTSFNALSHMKNLKLLEIDLGGIGHREIKEKQDLTLAFRYLKTAPKLETLILYHMQGPLYNFPKEEWLIELLDSLKLRNVYCYGFAMDNRTQYECKYEKIEWEELKRQPRWPRMTEDGLWLEDYVAEDLIQEFAEKNIHLVIQRGKRKNEVYNLFLKQTFNR